MWLSQRKRRGMGSGELLRRQVAAICHWVRPSLLPLRLWDPLFDGRLENLRVVGYREHKALRHCPPFIDGVEQTRVSLPV
jgi:hypothetical protein